MNALQSSVRNKILVVNKHKNGLSSVGTACLEVWNTQVIANITSASLNPRREVCVYAHTMEQSVCVER